jgi:hypothetical protein
MVYIYTIDDLALLGHGFLVADGCQTVFKLHVIASLPTMQVSGESAIAGVSTAPPLQANSCAMCMLVQVDFCRQADE